MFSPPPPSKDLLSNEGLLSAPASAPPLWVRNVGLCPHSPSLSLGGASLLRSRRAATTVGLARDSFLPAN